MDIKQIPYEEIDIADPKHKDDKLFMQDTLKLSDEDLKALPPQIFNDKKHRGVCNFKKLICWNLLFNHFKMVLGKMCIVPPNGHDYIFQIFM